VKHLLQVLLILILSLGSTTAWSAGDALELRIPYEKFVLKNGLRVIVHEDHKAPIVAVSVWYHVGSKDEPAGRTGFAHLFEHIMFEGSENNNENFDKALEQVGATSLNGTTWFDRTNYFENVPTPALELALFLESDRMGHLLGVLTQEKLDQERGVVQNEKRQGDSQPYGLAFYRILEGLFPEGHPYHHETIGSMKDLDAASLEDFKAWFNRYYGAANTVIVLAGDITPARGRELVEKYFGEIQPGPALNKMRAWVPDRVANTHEIMYDHVAQIRSYQNWAVPGRTTRDRALLELAAYVLGDGKSSRLYQALVHKTQYAVSLTVEVEAEELASLFTIDTTLRPGASLEEVNTIIQQQMTGFLAKGPSEKELKRARTKINAGVVRGLERVGGFAGKATTLAEGELYAGDPAFFHTLLGWIDQATPQDVRDAARRWLADGRFQLDVLPQAKFAAEKPAIDRSNGLPKTSDLPDVVFPQVQHAKLKNGIEVVLAERHAVPVVALSLQFDAGYAADAGGKLGTASYALAMLDESTKNRSALEIDEQAESLGAELNTSSTLDTSTVSLSALKANLAPSISLWADVVRNPAFNPAEIEQVRIRRLAQVQREKDRPIGIALRTLPPLIYGRDNAYGIPFTGNGTEASNKAINRDDLVKFQRDWLRPDNVTLFVVGDTRMQDVLPLLEKNFGDWRSAATKVPHKKITEVALPRTGRLLLVDKPGSPQSLILAAHIAPPTGVANNIAIELMNDVIGGEPSARVNQKLRVEKHWSYGAFTVLPDARGQRPWLVYAPVQTDKTAAAVSELNSEFEHFLTTEPARADELLRAVRSNTFSLPGQFETNAAVMGALLSNNRFGRQDDYVTNLKKRYQATSLQDVQQAATEVLHPEKLTWVIVGDSAKIRASLEQLNLAPVEMMNANGVISGE